MPRSHAPAELYSPATLQRAQRWTNVLAATHADFSGGIYPDRAGHLIPENGCFDAIDFLFDRAGIARKRGGTTGVFSGSQTAYGQVIGAYRSGGFDALRRIYTAQANPAGSGVVNMSVVDPSTGVATTQTMWTGVTAPVSLGRPFQHFDVLVTPQLNIQSAGFAGPLIAAGASFAKGAVIGTAATVAATSDTISGIVGFNASTAIEAGMIIQVSDATHVYYGRVVSLLTSTSVKVDPVPSVSFTGTNISITPLATWSGALTVGGMVGCTWQNRILLGNLQDWRSGSPGFFSRSVAFSLLPNEPATYLGLSVDGLNYLTPSSMPATNVFRIGGTDPITAMVPFGAGRLVIFSTTAAHQVTGNLTSQIAGQGGFTWDVQEMAQSVGCLVDRSVQRTPIGVIFASQEGIYATDGTGFKNLISGKAALKWYDDLDAGAHVIGSGYLRGHYYVSTDGYSYFLNLATGALQKVFGPTTNIFDAVPDPTTPSHSWGLRFYSGAPPSMTNGQAVRLDSMFKPTSANRADADGTSVQAQLITKAYLDGSLTGNKTFPRSLFSYDARNGTGGVERSVADPVEASWTSIGTLAATTTRTKRSLASVSQHGPSAAYRITTAACDSFNLYGITDLFLPESAESDV